MVLGYNSSHDFVTQQTYYNCGPGSSQLVLNVRGINVSEDELSQVLGTTVNGTPSIDNIAAGLNHYDPESKYASMWMPNDPPQPAEVQLMRERIARTIAWGRGCVANVVVPPANYPKAVPKADKSLPGADGVSPGYAGGIVYHYISVLGFDPSDDTAMVVDPGFQPSTYWVTITQLASMVTPHGIVWASGAPELAPAAPPAPAPGAPAPAAPAAPGIPCVIGRNGPKPYTARTMDDKLSHAAHEITMWLPGRSLKDGLQDVVANPARPDTTLGHSINAASLARVNHLILVRLAEKLGVNISDII
jgi:hypothetical protein